MWRLVESSDPDGVNRFNVRAHYTRRVVLTASVCRELGSASDNEVRGERARAAMGLLSEWMRASYALPDGNIDYDHGLDDPQLQQYASDLRRELDLGTGVCKALFMSYTADHRSDFNRDAETIRERLGAYRAEFGT